MRCAFVLFLLLAFAGGDSDLEDGLRVLQENIEDVAPGTGFRFELLSVADLVRPVPQFARHNPGAGEEPPFGYATTGRRTFRSARELADLIVGAVEPRSWVDAGFIETYGDTLVVYQSEVVLPRVRRFLDRLRSRLHRAVCVEVRVGTEFEGRTLGLSGQRVTLAHGAQRAFHGDPEVEVAKDNGQTTDPVIETLQTGGYLAVSATIGDDAARIRIELDVMHRKAPERLRTQTTGVNGELELPEIAQRDCRTDLIVDAGVWVRVSNAIEVRATPIPAARAR